MKNKILDTHITAVIDDIQDLMTAGENIVWYRIPDISSLRDWSKTIG